MKPVAAKPPQKAPVVRKKRNLNNATLKQYFGKGEIDIWDKDIKTGEGSFDA